MLREIKAPDATANHVLRVLSSYADEAGECYPSLETLAEQTQLDKSTVCRALDRLDAAGQIIRTRSKGRRVTKYRLELLPNATVLLSHSANSTVAQDNPTVAVRNVTVAESDTKLPMKGPLKIPTKVPRSRKEYTPTFEAFWLAYPNKVGKRDAFKAWHAINPSDDLTARILNAVAKAAQSHAWKKDGGQYIPYPGTWLRRDGWEDQLSPTPQGIQWAQLS
jgi:Fe2+ or Zn2+ uptake regulation protein